MKAANDNCFVQVTGGGNIGASASMLGHLFKAILIERSHPRGNPLSNSGTIYVIGEAEPKYCKIGKAKDPISRLQSLQTGNPNKLYLHRVFEFEKIGQVDRVERWSHEDASRLFKKAFGEWFECGPTQAHDVIAAIAEKERLPCRVFTPTSEPQWVTTHNASMQKIEMMAKVDAA